MSREELIRAYHMARADWMHAEDHQEAMYELVKQTPEYKTFLAAREMCQKLWEKKNLIEEEGWRECERTGDKFYEVFKDEDE